MALNIEGATIGFDANNVESALSNLNTRVIQDTIVEMNNRLGGLRDYIDSAWVGVSAEQFKTNMQSDVQHISDNLNATYDDLRSEMYQIVNEMAAADQELVKGRVE